MNAITSTTALDCRGLTTALTVLRIKQAVSTQATGDAPVRVVLPSGCSRDHIIGSLGGLADRVRYVAPETVTPSGVVVAGPPTSGTGICPVPEPTGIVPWWQRGDLRHHDGRLHLGGVDLDELATRVGTPTYVCRAHRVAENIDRLTGALAAAGLDHRIYYAIKANRLPALLTYLRTSGRCGVDVCSVGELMHALSCGYQPDDISFTGTSLSDQEIDVLARFRDLRINVDSVSALDRLGRACPGRDIGLRINPAVGVGYHDDERLAYSGVPTTKFGIYLEHIEEAKAVAQRRGLRVVRLHLHIGSGYLNAQLDQFAQALEVADAFTTHFPDLVEVNLGGGLGVPHTATDEPLDLARWADVLRRRFAGRSLRVLIEPGDYLVKDAGILLTTVTYVERRRDVLFAGLDAGFNLAMEPAFYDLPCEPVAVAPRWNEGIERYTVVGNINEALDVWAVDHHMYRLAHGDRVALINSGGYAASMRSDHCLRGQAREMLLID